MDPVVAGKTAEFLQATGPWGLVAICFAVIVMLYRDGIAMRAEIASIHKQRVAEVADLAEKTATGLARASATAAALTDETAANNRLAQRVLDVLQLLPPAIETNTRQLDANAGRMERVLDKIGGKS